MSRSEDSVHVTAVDGGTEQSPRRPPTFGLELRPDRDRVIVRTFGELDLVSADQLEQSIAELLGRGFQCFVVDLRGLTFLDSSGIRVLIASAGRCRDQRATMRVWLGGDVVRQPLEMSGAIDHLDVEPPR